MRIAFRCLGLIGFIAAAGLRADEAFDEKVKQLQPKAEAGDTTAMVALADLYSADTEDSEKTQPIGLQWYRRAAEKGEAKAQYELSQVYYHAEGTDNYPEAFKWLLKSAQQGYLEAMVAVGDAYEGATGVEANPGESFRWRRKVEAIAPDRVGYVLGVMYAEGRGTPANPLEAAKHFQPLVGSDAEADEKMAELLKAHPELSAQLAATAPAATQQLLAKAKQGDATAQLAVGRLFIDGKGGLVSDPAESTRWLLRAAEQGNAEAQVEVGHAFAYGNGVAEDAVQAVAWWRKSAAQKYAPGQHVLGWAYRTGTGVERNLDEAARWLRLSAAQGKVESMLLLAQMHESELAPQAEAVKWYERAAALGRVDAMLNAGDIYARQDDIASARKWYEAAKAKGNADADQRLEWISPAEVAARKTEHDKEVAAQAAQAETARVAAKQAEERATAAKLTAAEAEKAEAAERASDDVNFAGKIPAKVKGASRRLFRAALLGGAEAQFELGQLLTQGNGEGIDRDESAARVWLEASADQGNADAIKAVNAFYRARPALQRQRLAGQFDVEFETAPDLRRRKEALEHLSGNFYHLGLNEAEAADFLFSLMAPKIEARPDEAYELVLSLNGVEFKNEVMAKKLSATTWARVRADAAKVTGNYEALRQEMAKQGNLFARATAGDAEAAWQVAVFFFNNPVARDRADGALWAEKAAALGHPKAKQVLQVHGTDVYNDGVKAYNAGKRLEALRDFLLADEYGVKEGRLYIGLIYSTGVGPVKPDARKAIAWFQKASDDGMIEATMMLAVGYMEGLGVAKDPPHAVLLARAGAAKGSAAGMRLMGYYTLRGLGTPADENAAVTWFKQAGEKKDFEAVDWLTLLTDTATLEDRATLALQYAGNTMAENTGEHLGEPQDWLDYAAQLGQPAARRIQAIWHHGQPDVGATPETKAGFAAYDKKDFAGAMQHWRLAADAGNTIAQVNVGVLYQHGEGVPQDFDEARRWYEKAGGLGLLNGYVMAWELQNDVYERDGVAAHKAKKYAEAFALWEKAAQAGSALGLYYLGVYADTPEEGLPPRDENKALSLYRRAGAMGVDQGTARAIRLEATMVGRKELARGDAALKANDPKTAREEYEKSAQLGNSAAMRHLGFLYHDGAGVALDETKAIAWWKKAEALGDEEAAFTRAMMEDKATVQDGTQPAGKPEFESTDEAIAHLHQMVVNEKDNERQARAAMAARDRINAAAAGDAKPQPAPSVRDLLVQATAAHNAQRMAEAIRWFEQAADAGSTTAMTQLGLLYDKGTEVPQDRTKALSWYDKAAKLGDDNAAVLASVLREMVDTEKLIALKNKADAGDPQAQLDYAEGCEKDGVKDSARKWYLKVSENPRASQDMKKAAGLGLTRNAPADNGPAIGPGAAKKKDAAPAKPLSEAELKASALAGDALAQYDYGELLKKKGDKAGASEWFHKALANPQVTEEVKKWAEYATMDERYAAQAAADKAAKEAAATAAVLKDAAKKPKEPAQQTADDYFSTYSTLALFGGSQQAIDALHAAAKIAETGSPETRYRLAAVIMQGIFATPREPERAKALLVSAARDGFPAARLAYAQALITGGFGVTVDVPAGTAMLKEVIAGAETADGEVQHQSAMILFQGAFGTGPDRPRAIKLLTAAADKKVRESQYELGRALIGGIPPDLPADPVRGVGLLRQASEQGVSEAVVILGKVYEQGVGPVAANASEAYDWYKKAFNAGVPGAKEAMQRVKKNILAATPAVLAELQKKAEAGDPQAQFDYAETAEKQGNSSLAIEWYRKAAANSRAPEKLKTAARLSELMNNAN